jgi:hypothetical protein
MRGTIVADPGAPAPPLHEGPAAPPSGAITRPCLRERRAKALARGRGRAYHGQRMRPGPAPFLTSVLVLLACNDPSTPAPSDDTGSSTAASSTSSSGPDTRGDSSTGSLDTTLGTGAATSSTDATTTSALDGTGTTDATSSGPGESSSESTGPGPVNGCADGEREAFEDEVLYPSIAGCAGGFAVPGVVVNVPYCGRLGGDDGPEPSGAGCSVEDLCSDGWHVCHSRAEVMAAGVADCSAVAFGGAFFATRQSGEGSDTCNATGLNDVFGCGDIGHTNIVGCAPLNRSTANGCAALPAPWDCDTALAQEAQFITKEGPEFGGVLCCRD